MSLMVGATGRKSLRNRGVSRIEVTRERRGNVGAKPKTISMDIKSELKISLFREGRYIGTLWFKNGIMGNDCDISIGVTRRLRVRSNDDNVVTYKNYYNNYIAEFNDKIHINLALNSLFFQIG